MFLEASILSVANMATLFTFNDIYFSACSSFVTSLIAFEADLFSAIKRVVRVFTTKYARTLFSIIWAVLLFVTNLLTIVTLNCWVIFGPVTLPFQLLHIVESVILVNLILRPVLVVERFLII